MNVIWPQIMYFSCYVEDMNPIIYPLTKSVGNICVVISLIEVCAAYVRNSTGETCITVCNDNNKEKISLSLASWSS